MNVSALTQNVSSAFASHFGVNAATSVFAPGRVNLLGEHTDYNGGYVLPMALRDLGVSVAIGEGAEPGMVDAYSDTFTSSERRHIDERAQGKWSDYVLGCLQLAARDEIAANGCRIALSTTVPLGAGLSSSAALEVATLRAVSNLAAAPMTDVEIAISARKVENDFVGMPCGIMDQFASSVGHPGEALFLNTRTLEYAYASKPATHAFIVIHSGVSHQLTEDGYATRVGECEAACEALGVEILSDLDTASLGRIAAIPAPLDRRARHIISDNQRVLDGVEALRTGDVATFGRLLIESHASQRDDYEITVPETDALVERALQSGAIGARQTGGGFGGSVVALVDKARIETFVVDVVRDNSAARVLAIT